MSLEILNKQFPLLLLFGCHFSQNGPKFYKISKCINNKSKYMLFIHPIINSKIIEEDMTFFIGNLRTLFLNRTQFPPCNSP